ncbi:MAG: isoprenylcysteine carboxylmethyltransferase family protein [Pseudomonadota bacterium]|jgi:protein-S-isoprenylcysteine O-methyltransferase Ste14|nr:isoprenylcysteine carboxylmethyltransferase family protein [Pseudomonadota bacterium]|tara:strand:- start:31 stop:495 length:465 start_codon:yes stop_codon:yes gene_type:complete
MSDGPKIKGNPLLVSVYLLVICYVIGEFVIPKYSLLYPINLIGILGLVISLVFFFSGFNIFKSYAENPVPTSSSERLIKTGVFAYTRNPIYLSLVLFHLSMFLVFENVMYLLSAVGQTIWIHNYIIKFEEEYLLGKFTDEYQRYMNAVSRWLFF